MIFCIIIFALYAKDFPPILYGKFNQFAAQLLTESIVRHVGKSNSTDDLLGDIICAGNGGTKANRLVHNDKGIVGDHNLGSDTLHILTFRYYIVAFVLNSELVFQLWHFRGKKESIVSSVYCK